MDLAELARWRLTSQGLHPVAAATPREALDRLTASQAQDLTPGRWALGLRCEPAVTQEAVAAAEDAGELVRTHLLRPTWHLVAPPDLRWLLTATAERVHRASSTMYRRLGVDEALMTRVRAVLEDRLTGTVATRAELAEALGRAGIEASGQRLGYVVMWAELEGWVCSGPYAGGRPTYALLEERVAPADPCDRPESLRRLAGRYVASRGPATVRDLATWASLTLTEARRAVAELGVAVESFETGGLTYLVAAGSRPPPAPDAPVVRLLQAYDELVMSYAESRDVLTGGAPLWDVHDRVFIHHLVVDGRLAGAWRYDRDRTGRPASVTVRPARALTGGEREGLAGEVARFADFAEGPIALVGV